jgi:leucyl/phenylalanyl-tRNA--protein transferase
LTTGVIRWLRGPHDPLPDAERVQARTSEIPGLVAAGGELTPARLEEAYRKGIFPWFSDGQPTLWWSPDPRMVLLPDEFKLRRSLKKTIRRFLATPGATIRIDHATHRVIEACATVAREGESGTWIVAEMIDAYAAWHALGRVHSFETWIDGELAGGLYGVAIGRMVYGESMFAWRTDASKIALAALVAFCRAHGVALVDCQQNTSHLASFGAREITRAAFERHLAKAVNEPDIADWTYDSSLWARLDLGAAAPPDPDA